MRGQFVVAFISYRAIVGHGAGDQGDCGRGVDVEAAALCSGGQDHETNFCALFWMCTSILRLQSSLIDDKKLHTKSTQPILGLWHQRGR